MVECDLISHLCIVFCAENVICVILDPDFHVDAVHDPDPAWHYNDANPQNIFYF